MIEKRIQVEEGAHLTLDEMAGNVALSGWDEADVLIRLSDDRQERLCIEESDNGPVVSAQASCELLVPSHLPVVIRGVSGNLVVKNLGAQLNAEQVRGNLTMSDVQEAAFAEVYGRLKASDVSSLRVAGTIYGDAIIKGIQSIELQNIPRRKIWDIRAMLPSMMPASVTYRMSRWRMWLISWAMTPCSSSRLSRASRPAVTATDADLGLRPVAKALGA